MTIMMSVVMITDNIANIETAVNIFIGEIENDPDLPLEVLENAIFQAGRVSSRSIQRGADTAHHRRAHDSTESQEGRVAISKIETHFRIIILD
jgi:hypothetical protein